MQKKHNAHINNIIFTGTLLWLAIATNLPYLLPAKFIEMLAGTTCITIATLISQLF